MMMIMIIEFKLILQLILQLNLNTLIQLSRILFQMWCNIKN